MSEDLTGRTELVPGYAGHSDRRSRRLSDQQVRAWVGEILADLRPRLAAAGLAERLDDLLLHCEFGNQHVIRAIEDDRFAAPDAAEMVERADRTVVEAANRLKAAPPEHVPAALDVLERTFNERSASIEARLAQLKRP